MEASNKETFTAASFYLAAVGTALHHSSTALVICGVCRGLFPLSRPLSAACIVPVLQHCIVLLRYKWRCVYLALEFALEVYFEWEIVVNLESFTTIHGREFTRMARASALTMLVSHWSYLLSAAIDIFCDLHRTRNNPKKRSLERVSTIGMMSKVLEKRYSI